jgi:hypothetical protein
MSRHALVCPEQLAGTLSNAVAGDKGGGDKDGQASTGQITSQALG